MASTISQLREQISRTEQELQLLKNRLAQAQRRAEVEDEEDKVKEGSRETSRDHDLLNAADPPPPILSLNTGPDDGWKWPLASGDYERYSRQLIVPGVGVEGQLKLKGASVLIVGAGGLGCPAAAYLAGAGVGRIGIVDGDVVEVSNLHRQIGHSSDRVGVSKAKSLIAYLQSLNPTIIYTAYPDPLTPATATRIVPRFDLVLDCTDRPSTRYLVSDAAVAHGKPLVSASALRASGQLMALNHPPRAPGDPRGGPCYRCVFPRPPPPDTVQPCGEGGVLGPVVGVMGVLMALEALRIVFGPTMGSSSNGYSNGISKNTNDNNNKNSGDDHGVQPEMLLLEAGGAALPRFRTVRMRGRRTDCLACGVDSRGLGADTLLANGLANGLADYESFCGLTTPVRELRPDERVSAGEFAAVVDAGRPHVLLDVREREHFAVCNIPGAVNVPVGRMMRKLPPVASGGGADAETTAMAAGRQQGADEWWLPTDLPDDAPIYVVCRVGNDSQLVARRLKDAGVDNGGRRWVGDIKGGMRAWRDEVDNTMPVT